MEMMIDPCKQPHCPKHSRARTLQWKSSPSASKWNILWNGYSHATFHSICQGIYLPVHLHIHCCAVINHIALAVMSILRVCSHDGIIMKKSAQVTFATPLVRMVKATGNVFVPFQASFVPSRFSTVIVDLRGPRLLWHWRAGPCLPIRMLPQLLVLVLVHILILANTRFPAMMMMMLLLLVGFTMKSEPFGIAVHILQVLESFWFSFKFMIAFLDQARVRCFVVF